MQFVYSTLCPHQLHTITDNTHPSMQTHAPMCKTNPSTSQIKSPARQGNAKPHCQNIVCNTSHPTPQIWACAQLETCSSKCNLEGPEKNNSRKLKSLRISEDLLESLRISGNLWKPLRISGNL